MRASAAFLWCALAACAAAASRPMDVYVIDVEGGKSVLVVSPAGESLLFDVGWPGFGGRDVSRILEAAKAAGVHQIDYLVVSHYDVDHMGDVPALVAQIPVKHIVDHGPLAATGRGFEERYKPYAEVRDKLPYTPARPGDKIPIQGLDVTVIASAGKLLAIPFQAPGSPTRYVPPCRTNRSGPATWKITRPSACSSRWVSSACWTWPIWSGPTTIS